MRSIAFAWSFRGLRLFNLETQACKHVWIILNRMIGRNIGYMKEIAGCTTRKALRNQLISKRGSSNYKDEVCSKGVYHIHKLQSLVEASVI